MVLLIDNYDSFVFNLVQYLGQLGVDAQVWRNDDERFGDLDGAELEGFDGILLSPGPHEPLSSGDTLMMVGPQDSVDRIEELLS